MFGRRHAELLEPRATPADDLALLRRIAAEAVILQDDAEQLLVEIRERRPLAALAPRGGELASRFVRLARWLPESPDPRVRGYAQRLREVLDHHALMITASLKLYSVSWQSERLEDEVDRIAGLGRPGQWLEDLWAELASGSPSRRAPAAARARPARSPCAATRPPGSARR